MPYHVFAIIVKMAWSKRETLKLIEIWGNDAIQAQLEGCKRNQEVFTKIAGEMVEAGYERTAQQCREKVKKLKVEYRKVKDKRNKTGEGRYPEWDYFDALNAILGHKPATQPPIVVNSLGESDTQEPVHVQESPPSPELFDQACGSERATSEESSTSTPVMLQPRKRKRSKNEKMESLNGEIVDKLVDAQRNSDRVLVELEEKRLKFEEKQMEREALQRREEREFQLRIMQMMMGQCYGTPLPAMPTMGPPSQHMYTFPLHTNDDEEQ